MRIYLIPWQIWFALSLISLSETVSLHANYIRCTNGKHEMDKDTSSCCKKAEVPVTPDPHISCETDSVPDKEEKVIQCCQKLGHQYETEYGIETGIK